VSRLQEAACAAGALVRGRPPHSRAPNLRLRPIYQAQPQISGARKTRRLSATGDRRQATGDTAGGDLCKVHSTSETTRNYPIALSIDDAIADLNVWVSELDKCVP